MSAILRIATHVAVRPTFAVRSMATGTVKWFNQSKGFGFITPDEASQPDVFVHHSGIQSTGYRTLNDGEAVKYDLQRTDRGTQAVNVTDPAGKPFNRPSSTGAPRRAPSGGPRRPRERRSSAGEPESA